MIFWLTPGPVGDLPLPFDTQNGEKQMRSLNLITSIAMITLVGACGIVDASGGIGGTFQMISHGGEPAAVAYRHCPGMVESTMTFSGGTSGTVQIRNVVSEVQADGTAMEEMYETVAGYRMQNNAVHVTMSPNDFADFAIANGGQRLVTVNAHCYPGQSTPVVDLQFELVYERVGTK